MSSYRSRPVDTSRTPHALGFRMPPEWHAHEATWLAWPKNRETWGDRLPAVQDTYLEMISALSHGEQVRLLVDGPTARQQVEERLSKRPVGSSGIAFYEIPTVDAWIRDYGPNFLVRQGGSGTGAYNHWGFNAWGGKYEDLKADSRIPEQLQPYLGLPRFRPSMILEGGAVDVNGSGYCLTTEECLLHPGRNPGLTREENETFLRAYLGVEKVVWLRGEIPGDDTDGHIDNIARFAADQTIVCAVDAEPTGLLNHNYRKLQDFRRRDGQAFSVIPMPVPKPVCSDAGPLPASYMNFYIANTVVLAPVFHQEADQLAVDTLESLFPGREVRPIYSEPLIHGCGAIHCLTQQQPSCGKD